MKALVLEKYNKLVYTDVPDPVLADDEVLGSADRMSMGWTGAPEEGSLRL